MKASKGSVWGYSDAAFDLIYQSKRSQGGAIIYYGDSPISFFSKKLTLVTTSTFEAEMLNLVVTTKDLLIALGTIKELRMPIEEGPIIYTDSQTTLEVLSSEVLKKRSKHVAIKIAYLRDLVNKKILRYEKIPGEENLADAFTKALDREKHAKFDVLRIDSLATSRRPVNSDQSDAVQTSYDLDYLTNQITESNVLEHSYLG